jgi:uncharacterized protein YidB (DUF937 family)
MGLLDDLLGGLKGNAPSSGLGADRPVSNTASAGGMGPLLTALLPVVLSMLSSGAQAGNRGGGTGGGIGDVLSQVLGGRAGSGGGGLGGLLDQFQRAGFGAQAGSWVGTGANQPIPADALGKVFGEDGIAEIARRAGLSPDDTSRGLAQVLPEVVDHVTPDGQLPEGDKLLSSVDALTRRLGIA